MLLWLIPLDHSLPVVQEWLAARREPLDAAETQAAAELLARCAQTGEVLVAFALRVGGRPGLQ